MKIKLKKVILMACLVYFSLISITRAGSNLPQLFLFLGGDDASLHFSEMNSSCVSGVQIIYSWKQLETQKNHYDFSKIENDLHFLLQDHKQLWVQIQDRSFEPDQYPVPDYIRQDSVYHGGVAPQSDEAGNGKKGSGWVARVWDPAVRERFQKLIFKLAEQFDGKITGINFPETAFDFDEKNPPADFTPDRYFLGTLDNLHAARRAFSQSRVMQYVNFFPGEWNNDHGKMTRLFLYARQHQIELGGPDGVPYWKTQMENSYPFFHLARGRLKAGIAIQEPDYNYQNPKTGRVFSFQDFYDFSKNYLGAQIIFWNIQEPFFSEQLKPAMNAQYFRCDSK